RVGDATAAVGQLRQTEFDLLIADIHMPGNVGLELIQDLRQIVSGLPVILITGRPSVETAAKSVRLSVAAYLVKPPDLVEPPTVVRHTIASFRHVRSVMVSRQRLQDWSLDLERIEFLLRHTPGEPDQSSL